MLTAEDVIDPSPTTDASQPMSYEKDVWYDIPLMRDILAYSPKLQELLRCVSERTGLRGAASSSGYLIPFLRDRLIWRSCDSISQSLSGKLEHLRLSRPVLG